MFGFEGAKKRRPRSKILRGKGAKAKKGLKLLQPSEFGPYDRIRLIMDDFVAPIGRGDLTPRQPGVARAQIFFLRPGEEFDEKFFEETMDNPSRERLEALPPHIVFFFHMVDMGEADPLTPGARNIGATPMNVGITRPLQHNANSPQLRKLQDFVAQKLIAEAYGIMPEGAGGTLHG